jgi:hypothetical protein
MTEHPRTTRLCQGDLAAGHLPASDNGENGSGQNLENQGPSGLVGLCRAFEFKKCFEDTRRAQIRNPAGPATIRRAATIHSHRFPSIPSFFGFFYLYGPGRAGRAIMGAPTARGPRSEPDGQDWQEVRAARANDWNSKRIQRFWGRIPKVFPNDSKRFQSFPTHSNHFLKKMRYWRTATGGEDGRWQGQRLGYQGPLGFISLY